MAMASTEISMRENTMESLKEFLLNMKRTIERICADHRLAAKHGNTMNSRSPHSVGAFGTRDCLQRFQGAMPESAEKFGQIQNPFTSQSPTTTSQGVSKCRKANMRDCSSPLSEAEIGNALSVFLQDIKKTIVAWSYQYQLLVEGKTLDATLPQPWDPGVHAIDQLDFGQDDVVEVLDLRNSEALQVCRRPQPTRTNQGRKGRKVDIQSHPSRRDATLFSLQDFNEVLGRGVTMDGQDACYNNAHGGNSCTKDLSEQDMQEPDNNGAIVLVEKANGKAGQCKRKSRRKSTTPVISSQELTIRNFQCKVEVVESPDWLPQGWITELKTRTSGSSAGSKDKNYYDPVSKRRCRSQKEVFSLLETGKLGRYKPRANKLQPSTKGPGAEACPARPKRDDVSDIQGLSMCETATNALPRQTAPETTSSGMLIAPYAISPAGSALPAVNHMFLPYRPGQPSDWLVYESLTNTPRPALENFRFTEAHATRTNGDRGISPSWPWFLNNPDSSMRPPDDGLGMGKATLGGGKDDLVGMGGQVSAATREKRARKPSKRTTLSS